MMSACSGLNQGKKEEEGKIGDKRAERVQENHTCC